MICGFSAFPRSQSTGIRRHHLRSKRMTIFRWEGHTFSQQCLVPDQAMGQYPVPSFYLFCTKKSPKIVGKWMLIPLKMVLIGVDPWMFIPLKTLWDLLPAGICSTSRSRRSTVELLLPPGGMIPAAGESHGFDDVPIEKPRQALGMSQWPTMFDY